MMLVFTLAFRKLGRVETQGAPYPVFVFAGLTLWLFFSRAVSSGADSLVTNAQLLTKTSCPRLLMPVASILSAFVDFVMTFVLLIIFEFLYGKTPTWRIVFVLVALLIAMALAFGMSLVLSAINVEHRDIRALLPLFLQFLLFVSPIAYSLERLGPKWQILVAVNPLVGIVTLFRWAVLATPGPTTTQLALSCSVAVAMVAVGLVYFARIERMFADVA
jgi:lipopolysaccharide transport system permease protein